MYLYKIFLKCWWIQFHKTTGCWSIEACHRISQKSTDLVHCPNLWETNFKIFLKIYKCKVVSNFSKNPFHWNSNFAHWGVEQNFIRCLVVMPVRSLQMWSEGICYITINAQGLPIRSVTVYLKIIIKSWSPEDSCVMASSFCKKNEKDTKF